MKRILSLLCLMLMLSLVAFAKGNEMPQYDITGAGSGNEGMLLVKVFVYSKKVTDQDLKRAAVHGVVFRGCSGNNSGAKQPAMASGRIWPPARSKAWSGIIRMVAASKSRKRIFLETRLPGRVHRMVAPSVDGESTGCLAMQTQLNHDSGRPMVSFSWVISIRSKPASDNNEVNRLGVIQL